VTPRSGPLRAVLTAIDDGAGTIAEIRSRTGLRIDVVTAALEHLERAGEVSLTVLTSGCPAGGCAGCALRLASGTGADLPGCGASAPDPDRRGPALVGFTRRRS
jgi:hypothetical protein